MLISKFDLYKSGWLELVFENRNKAYGAYELRQHYAKTMVRAMGYCVFRRRPIVRGKYPVQRRTDGKQDHCRNYPDNTGFTAGCAPPVKKLPPPPSHAIKQVTPVNPPAMTKVYSLL